uniref:PPM-type phosphatase domain-containing protein n=1 Tax=Steinernema glaseri TaxID=37863 RepID=A0A1I8A6S2_9BILA
MLPDWVCAGVLEMLQVHNGDELKHAHPTGVADRDDLMTSEAFAVEMCPRRVWDEQYILGGYDVVMFLSSGVSPEGAKRSDSEVALLRSDDGPDHQSQSQMVRAPY